MIIFRIHFPDRYELSGDFLPSEKLPRVFAFIREHLRAEVPANWLVYTTPPRKNLDEAGDQNLLQLGYVPAVKLYFETGNPKLLFPNFSYHYILLLFAVVTRINVL